MATVITITTCDNVSFKITTEVAKMSVTIRNMLENLETENEEAVPLSNILSNVASKVFEWMEHHKDDPEVKADETNDGTKKLDIGDWDINFFKVERDLLFGIINAANFLDISLLLHMGCQVVATAITGKTPEEIRLFFNLVNDFTLEEEEQTRLENEWCMER